MFGIPHGLGFSVQDGLGFRMVLGFRGLSVSRSSKMHSTKTLRHNRLTQVLSDRAVACGSIGAAAGAPVLCWDARALRRGVKL